MILRNPSFWRDFLFLICSFVLYATPVTLSSQGISGTVKESGSNRVVPNAIVTIIQNDFSPVTFTSDSLGLYQYVSDIAGRVNLSIQALGYKQYQHEDFLLDGYSTFYVESFIDVNPYELKDIVVTSSRIPAPHVRKIYAEDLAFTAGNFDDPVRVAHSQPGIIQINDQANHLSARGQQPAFNSWYLEGLEIINPNHTNNAGTFFDLPTQSGGGVNLFSAQTLGTTDIYTGLNPLNIGRSAGAAIDMHLHESAKEESRAKAGLLGFEFGRGIKMGSRSMLDINARYSFTGLLADIGVDFGGEEIRFMDLVASYNHSGTNNKLKIFLWGGQSKNEFNRIDQVAERLRYKDFFDINFQNLQFGAGIKYHKVVSSTLSLHAGASLSSSTTDYSRIGQFGPLPVAINLNESHSIVSSLAELHIKHSASINSTAGVNYTFRSPTNIGPVEKENFIRPYLSTTVSLSNTLKLEAGGEINQSFISNQLVPGYRAVLEWSKNNLLIYTGLRHSAGQALIVPQGDLQQQSMIVDKYELGMKYAGQNNVAGLNIYFQQLEKLVNYQYQNSIVNVADFGDLLLPVIVDNNGAAKYYGVEAEWESTTNNGWKFSVNQTFYSANTGTSAQVLSMGKFNGGYASHFLIAKEIIRERKEKNRIWMFSLRGLLNGGLWEPAIDPGLSMANEMTLFSAPHIFSNRLPAYKRIDASISRTISNANVRWRFSLDIQNLTSFENVSHNYYDPYTLYILPQKQLGIIPVLAIQASW